MGGISEISPARHIGICVATRWWQRFDGKNHAKLKKTPKTILSSDNIMQHLARQQQFMAGNQNVINKTEN
jgi:hypothetical protein